MDKTGHNADLAVARGDDTRAIRPDQPRIARLGIVISLNHIRFGNAFGNTDNQLEASIGRFHDRIRGKRRRHENDGDICTRRLDPFGDGVEDRHTLKVLTALTRCCPTDDLGAVFDHLFGMERPFSACNGLHEDFRIFVN